MPKMIFSFLLVLVVVFSVYQVIINTPKEFLFKFLKSLFPILVIVSLVSVFFYCVC